MNAQPQDVQAILTRIEKLESQNRRWEQVAVSGLLFLATVVLALCGMSGCGVTDVPKGPYQAEIKVTPEPYQFQRLNEYTFALVNQKTGQVWECSIRESKCTQVMYPTLNPKTNSFTNFTSIPDASVAVIEK